MRISSVVLLTVVVCVAYVVGFKVSPSSIYFDVNASAVTAAKAAADKAVAVANEMVAQIVAAAIAQALAAANALADADVNAQAVALQTAAESFKLLKS